MSAQKSLLSFVAALVVIAAAPSARAYCRASTCDEGPLCGPPPWDDPTCKPLAWMRPCVGMSVNVSASEEVPFDVAQSIAEASFAAWEEASCDAEGGYPSIHVQNLGGVPCDLVEYNSAGGNANVIAFRDVAWPHPTGPHNIALTTVTYDKKTGEIYDADMEINTAGFDFSTGDADVKTDLLSVVTHEAGHFLGLAHSEIPEATMWANYTPGTIDARTLSPDDVTLVCSVYPPSSAPIDEAQCNPIPRHGFSPECLSNQTEGDCSVKSSRGASASSLLMGVVALACAAVRRRRVTNRSARRAP